VLAGLAALGAPPEVSSPAPPPWRSLPPPSSDWSCPLPLPPWSASTVATPGPDAAGVEAPAANASAEPAKITTAVAVSARTQSLRSTFDRLSSHSGLPVPAIA
jgi:hypothetical protein